MTTVLPSPEVDALITGNTQLIGGEWVPASSGETIDVLNPATGEVLSQVPHGRAEDVDAPLTPLALAPGRGPAERARRGGTAPGRTDRAGPGGAVAREGPHGTAHQRASPPAPFGGHKRSGFGRTMGADAVLDYTQVKAVSLRGTD